MGSTTSLKGSLTAAGFAARLFHDFSLSPETHFVVAFSGGLDSAVLLDLCAQTVTRGHLRAIHIDHGLQVQSAGWAESCADQCHARGIPCEIQKVQVRGPGDHGWEAQARLARYEGLQARLGAGEVLLTAHHQNDQAETLLLRLLRGAGPLGLAAIKPRRVFGPGALIRPLLSVSRAELRRYAQARGLHWIEDPSNEDPRFDRNYLRHQVLPALERRWARAVSVIARAARYQQDAAVLLAEYAAHDLALIQAPDGSLAIPALRDYSTERLAHVLRQWVRQRGLPAPEGRHLDALTAGLRQEPLRNRYTWPGVDLRCYRGRLYAVPPAPRALAQDYAWDWRDPLPVPELGLRLRAVATVGCGVATGRAGIVVLKRRAGGERLQYQGHVRVFKKLLQAHGIPPWERARLPLLFAGTTLVAVPPWWIATPFQAGPGEAGVEILVESLQPSG